MVEQFNAEGFATLSNSDSIPIIENINAESHIPPIHTKTWFHLGIYQGRHHVSNYFGGLINEKDRGEYYRERAWKDDDIEARKYLLDDTVLPTELTVDEEFEACRALRGQMLRQEVYSDDGTEKAEHPYIVTEQNFTIKVVQPRNRNKYAIFFTHVKEIITYNYERNPEIHEPLIQ